MLIATVHTLNLREHRNNDHKLPHMTPSAFSCFEASFSAHSYTPVSALASTVMVPMNIVTRHVPQLQQQDTLMTLLSANTKSRCIHEVDTV
jgi:hypothetical protein